jgi:hypothetical protein
MITLTEVQTNHGENAMPKASPQTDAEGQYSNLFLRNAILIDGTGSRLLAAHRDDDRARQATILAKCLARTHQFDQN